MNTRKMDDSADKANDVASAVSVKAAEVASKANHLIADAAVKSIRSARAAAQKALDGAKRLIAERARAVTGKRGEKTVQTDVSED